MHGGEAAGGGWAQGVCVGAVTGGWRRCRGGRWSGRLSG